MQRRQRRDELALPWTGYLVAAAVARRDWWTGFQNTYVGLAGDRNTAETAYSGQLAAAYVDREQQIGVRQEIDGDFVGDGSSARPAAASVVSLTIPTHWETWQAAKLIYEAAMGYVAAEALPHLRDSFIQFADALTSSPQEDSFENESSSAAYWDADDEAIRVAIGRILLCSTPSGVSG